MFFILFHVSSKYILSCQYKFVGVVKYLLYNALITTKTNISICRLKAFSDGDKIENSDIKSLEEKRDFIDSLNTLLNEKYLEIVKI